MVEKSQDVVIWQERQYARRILWVGIGLATLATLAYIFIYWYDIEPESLDSYLSYLLTLLAALAAAVTGALVWRQYQPGELPRRVWGFFALALWSWAIGQAIWLVLRPFYESFPDVFYFDIFWTLGYICFATALFYQYRLIYHPTPVQERRWVVYGLLGVLVGIMTLALIVRGRDVGETLLGTFLYILYPAADLMMGGLGVNLSRLFGRGLWGRPWWGLVAFAAADTFWTWYDLGGYDFLVSLTGIWASVGAGIEFIFDVLYFDAYLLFAVACLVQFLAMKYGPQMRNHPLQPAPMEA